MPTVFLSSVARGLKQYRDAAYQAIEGLDGYHCVRMEDFGARSGTPYSVCLAKVAECDLFIGLVGHQYGSIAPNTGKSYSESEYDAAVAAGKPTLMLMAPEEFPVPANLIESDALREKQITFRAQVSSQYAVAFFSGPSTDELKQQVIQAIHNRRSEGMKEGAITPGPPSQNCFSHSLRIRQDLIPASPFQTFQLIHMARQHNRARAPSIITDT